MNKVNRRNGGTEEQGDKKGTGGTRATRGNRGKKVTRGNN